MAATWIVTGSSVGLGREIVTAALAAGHNVVGTARDPQTLSEFETLYPDSFLAHRLDVTQPEEAIAAAHAAVARFGSLDVLISNAAFSGLGAVEDMPIELIEAQLATNFMGTVHAIRAVLPTMRAQRSGRIILVSSIGARIATPGAAIYYASKAAVSALAETLALEVAPFGIRVTAAEPGAMRTRFAEATSLKTSPINPDYSDTVGATVAMMQSPQFQKFQQDPARYADMILELAALPAPPARILAGADALEMGMSADAARLITDRQWQALSRSATPA